MLSGSYCQSHPVIHMHSSTNIQTHVKCINLFLPAITVGERCPPSALTHIWRVKLPFGISTPGLSLSWSPLPVKYTAFPREELASSAGEERPRWRGSRRSSAGKERLPRGSRVAQAPGKTALASLIFTSSRLDRVFLRTVPQSDPTHRTSRMARHWRKVQTFILFKTREMMAR